MRGAVTLHSGPHSATSKGVFAPSNIRSDAKFPRVRQPAGHRSPQVAAGPSRADIGLAFSRCALA